MSTYSTPPLIYPSQTQNTSGPGHHGNWSRADLIRLNDEYAVTLIPAMLVMVFYMIVGGVGNLLVCYVMGYKLKMNTQNLLIVYLAIFDLLSCLISMPTDIFDMRNSYMFPSEIACKILRMIMAFNSFASILTLVVIAVDRYRMICKPMKRQMDVKQAKLSLILVLFGALFFSWPALLIFGFRTIDTGIPGMPGKDCSTSDVAEYTAYPMIYLSVLFATFIAISVAIITIYCAILAATRRHTRYMSSKSFPSRLTFKPDAPRVGRTKSPVSILNDTNSSSLPVDHCDTGAKKELGKKHGLTRSNCNDDNHDNDIEDSNEGDGDVRNTHGYLHSYGIGDIEQEIQCMEEVKGEGDANNCAGCVYENGGLTQTGTHTIERGNCDCNSDIDDKTQSGNLNRISDSGGFSNLKTIESTNCIGDIEIEMISGAGKDHESLNNSHSFNLSPESDEKKTARPYSTQAAASMTDSEKKGGTRKMSYVSIKLPNKTTIIAFVVTLVFILSFLPYLCFQVYKTFHVGFDTSLSGAALVAYHIFLRSYYINSVSNPFIYGVLNIRFRNQLRSIFSDIWQQCCVKCRR